MRGKGKGKAKGKTKAKAKAKGKKGFAKLADAQEETDLVEEENVLELDENNEEFDQEEYQAGAAIEGRSIG